MNRDDIPKITLHEFDRSFYIKQLAEVERQISSYKNLARFGINETMKKIFNIHGDCFTIFDKRAGGVLFKDWEWELIPNTNKIKELFETKKNGKLVYCLDTDEGKMLRGADTYYYYLTNKQKSQKVNVDMVYEWTKNNVTFLNDFLKVLPTINYVDINNRRLLLGILDNVRNISLIMLNTSIVKYSKLQNSIIELSGLTNNEDINKWSKSCGAIEKYIKLLCFTNNIDETFLNDINDTIYTILKNYTADINKILDNPKSTNLDKSFRSYREIDNFIENYIAIYYAIQKIKETKPDILGRKVNFIGATYGGLELPFIANEILNDEIMMSAIILQSKYKDRNPEEYISKPIKAENFDDLNSTFNILGDDNVLTGKTLQAMINLLFSNNIAVDNIAIVRYPSINRVNQMMAEDSAIDTEKFFNYIQGLVFSSPYTKIKENNSGLYLDELGIFNKDRRRLLEYLYKNGIYADKSEVAEIGNMYERR